MGAMVSCGLSAQNILFDQTSSPTGTGTASQDFESTYNQYDCMQADDFIVPSGEVWSIDSVLIIGSYSATATETAGVVTRFMNNHSSNKPGSLVWDTTISANADPDSNGTLLAEYATPFVLSAGHYWLGGAARKDFASGGGQWYWYHDSTGGNHDIHWRNPGNGFSSGCTNWALSSGCVSTTAPGGLFRIYGCKIVDVGTIGNDTAVCEGDVVTFDVSSSNTNLSYLWNTGDTTSSIDADSTGTYTVTITDNNGGCEVVQSAELIVNASLLVEIDDDTICNTDPGTSFSVSNCGGCTYVWSDSSTSSFLWVTDEGWYSVTVTNASGCVGTDSAYLTVETPNVQISNGDSINLCEGDTVVLSTAGAYPTYIWRLGTAQISDSLAVEITEGGSYSVLIVTENGCQAADTIEVAEKALPQPTITQGWSSTWKVTLDAPTGYQAYEWSNGSDKTGIKTSNNGTYTVTVTDEFGCKGEASIVVVVAGTDEMSELSLSVFPNPATDQLHLTWPAEWLGEATADLVDVNGKIVAVLNATDTQQTIDVSTLPEGYYLLNVSSPEGHSTVSVVKQ